MTNTAKPPIDIHQPISANAESLYRHACQKHPEFARNKHEILAILAEEIGEVAEALQESEIIFKGEYAGICYFSADSGTRILEELFDVLVVFLRAESSRFGDNYRTATVTSLIDHATISVALETETRCIKIDTADKRFRIVANLLDAAAKIRESILEEQRSEYAFLYGIAITAYQITMVKNLIAEKK